MIEIKWWVLDSTTHELLYDKVVVELLLGSKDLGFYVFRTLMCIVGKP